MTDIVAMKKEEECLGKYASKKAADEMARTETIRTGVKHHSFFTHYYCPYDYVMKTCWTILLSKKKGK